MPVVPLPELDSPGRPRAGDGARGARSGLSLGLRRPRPDRAARSSPGTWPASSSGSPTPASSTRRAACATASSASIYGLTALMVFFAIDGHHQFLRALVGVLRGPADRARAGGVRRIGVTVAHDARAWSSCIGAQLAAPVVIVLLVVELGLGLLSRAAPMLNLMAQGFPIRLLVGLLALAAVVRVIPAVIARGGAASRSTSRRASRWPSSRAGPWRRRSHRTTHCEAPARCPEEGAACRAARTSTDAVAAASASCWRSTWSGPAARCGWLMSATRRARRAWATRRCASSSRASSPSLTAPDASPRWRCSSGRSRWPRSLAAVAGIVAAGRLERRDRGPPASTSASSTPPTASSAWRCLARRHRPGPDARSWSRPSAGSSYRVVAARSSRRPDAGRSRARCTPRSSAGREALRLLRHCAVAARRVVALADLGIARWRYMQGR